MSMLLRVSMVLAWLSCAPSCAHVTSSHHAAAEARLERARTALGGARWREIAVVASRGNLEAGGLRGRFESLEDVRSGRSQRVLELGAQRMLQGFDGTQAWTRDFGGEVALLDAPAARALARTEAFLTRRGYLDGHGAHYRALGARQVDGETFDVVEAVPEGGVPVALWFDARTDLLSRATYLDGQDRVVTRYDDYRDVGGVRIAFRAITDRGDDVRNRVTVVTDFAELRPPLPDAIWLAPRTDEERLTFRGGRVQTEVPFELVNHHIYVQGSVNGQPVRLLVDTGGVNLLTPAAVARLGLTSEGKLAARGVGEQQEDLALAHGESLAVGDVVLARPVFYVIDLGRLLDVEGADFDGLVGYELFQRLGVRIDYPRRVLTLTQAARFEAPQEATAVPFVLRDRIPIVQGSVDGLPASFTVDTGSRASLTMHAPFVRKHRLVARYAPRFETITGWGIGPLRSWPVRFREVTVGGVTVHGVAGDLYTGDKGAFADPDSAGNLGGGVLGRFVVSFDYRARTMYLEPGPDVAAPDPYDRAGMFVLRDGDALRVAAVTPGGPAEKAGIAVDDRILRIDGTAASARSLATWREQLATGAPGTALSLTVSSQVGTRDVRITLTELLP